MPPVGNVSGGSRLWASRQVAALVSSRNATCGTHGHAALSVCVASAAVIAQVLVACSEPTGVLVTLYRPADATGDLRVATATGTGDFLQIEYVANPLYPHPDFREQGGSLRTMARSQSDVRDPTDAAFWQAWPQDSGAFSLAVQSPPGPLFATFEVHEPSTNQVWQYALGPITVPPSTSDLVLAPPLLETRPATPSISRGCPFGNIDPATNQAFTTVQLADTESRELTNGDATRIYDVIDCDGDGVTFPGDCLDYAATSWPSYGEPTCCDRSPAVGPYRPGISRVVFPDANDRWGYAPELFCADGQGFAPGGTLPLVTWVANNTQWMSLEACLDPAFDPYNPLSAVDRELVDVQAATSWRQHALSACLLHVTTVPGQDKPPRRAALYYSYVSSIDELTSLTIPVGELLTAWQDALQPQYPNAWPSPAKVRSLPPNFPITFHFATPWVSEANDPSHEMGLAIPAPGRPERPPFDAAESNPGAVLFQTSLFAIDEWIVPVDIYVKKAMSRGVSAGVVGL